jgi:cytochrome c biogenesis protein
MGPGTTTYQVARRAWRYATRLEVAAVILVVVAVVAVAGSLFPQIAPETAADPQRLAAWAEGLHARYGGWADLLLSSGAVRFFSAPLFLIPWAVLLAATLLCTLNRWRSVWRSMAEPPIHCPDTVLDTAPYTTHLQVSPIGQPMTALSQALAERGFRVRTQTLDGVCFLRADRHRLAPLTTLVTHLAVFLLLLGVLLEMQLAWREELTLPLGQPVEVGHNTGLQVSNEGFAVVRYPNGTVASYEAAIRLREAHARIRINEPFVDQGVGFYLRGYQVLESGTVVTLLAAYDPGYAVVVVAGFMLFLGVTVTFTLPACRVRACLAAEGTLRVSGWAERQAYGFEREFAGVVAEMEAAYRQARGAQPC